MILVWLRGKKGREGGASEWKAQGRIAEEGNVSCDVIGLDWIGKRRNGQCLKLRCFQIFTGWGGVSGVCRTSYKKRNKQDFSWL